MEDEKKKYMERAVELALKGKGFVSPNPMVGAVIVKDGVVLGEGWHRQYGGLHAEREALAAAKGDVRGADMYVTLEPCCHYGKQPPCTEAVIKSGIKRVFVGSDDPNPLVNGKGTEILRNSGIEVTTGVLKEKCDSINGIFFHYINTKMPYCVCKFAMSADGKIAAASGESQWISCEKSRQKVHAMRGEYRGILVGIGTVLADDPMLNCRISGMRSPVRIICDSHLNLPLESKIVKTASEYETIAACLNAECEKAEKLREAGVKVLEVKEKDGKLDMRDLFSKLGELKIDSLMVEGGGEINFSVLREGLCNKVLIFAAPMILGGRASKTPVEGDGVESLKDAIRLKEPEIYKIGSDVVLEYEVI
ncbi:MAG: bifunctional diaminohydroxyphosphoribosylaminopyrimidine deaminase/5-amino-6-(5-phosphoribosylamino)uracil reductase RibD [Clostridiales bacterium]|nr:bifunctional diaminohydroxyphosphoribosylaminopyrimidine deaminase/5-amino-6-(5-phosphoribosylamino)uracil reductase RibD [Clostridiales bacterium]